MQLCTWALALSVATCETLLKRVIRQMPFLCFVRYIYPRNNVHISLGAGEILTFWHHMKLTIPAELWGQITHILVYLWGILLDGGMTEKEIKSLCCLSTFAWTFPATSAAHFLAFAFLATTFWSKECVMTGIEGLMSSGSVTDWLAHYSGWGTHFVGLSAWTSGQTLHTATAYLPTSVWGWPISFEDLYEPT